ncbi:MAG: hypothetical protein GX268_05445 [Methanomicrobiales archaeon]|nr:hypothetical protein [Methanomicrobiales archaeon]
MRDSIVPGPPSLIGAKRGTVPGHDKIVPFGKADVPLGGSGFWGISLSIIQIVIPTK